MWEPKKQKNKKKNSLYLSFKIGSKGHFPKKDGEINYLTWKFQEFILKSKVVSNVVIRYTHCSSNANNCGGPNTLTTSCYLKE